jgi:hypothetical protein
MDNELGALAPEKRNPGDAHLWDANDFPSEWTLCPEVEPARLDAYREYDSEPAGWRIVATTHPAQK